MSGKSLITPEMECMVGMEFGPDIYDIEKGMVQKYVAALEDLNPRWLRETPPTYVMSACHLVPMEEWLMSLRHLPNMLNGGMEMENFLPVKPGDVITVTGKLLELVERTGKTIERMVVAVFENSFFNQRGELVARGRMTFIKY
ncbi:MAG: MaoC family dehydratase N-terminal domain-containing protein [Chloroflexota bacterium]